MAETAKPKTSRKTGSPKPAAKTTAKSKSTRAKKPAAVETSEAAETSAAADNGHHVKITPPPKPEKNSVGAWFLLVLLIIVCGGAGYLTWPKWKPYVAAYLPDGFAIAIRDSRVDGLSERVGGLENATETLKQKDKVIARLESERQKLSQSLSGVLARIESLEHSIGAVKEMAKAAATAEEAAQATKSLKELNKRLTSMEKAPHIAGTPNTELASRLEKLERDRTVANELAQRIAQLEAQDADSRKARQETIAKLTRSATSLSAMDTRLRAVEGRPAGFASGEGKNSAVVLAVAQLRDAVHRGRPYPKVLQGVKAVAGDDPAMKAALAGLEKHAAAGIPTLSVLQGEFAGLAGQIAAAGRDADDGGWFDGALVRILSLVKFRRIDGSGGSGSVDSLVAQAEKHLAGGDLIAAVKSVEELRSAAASTAAPWLARAKARLAAEQSLATLHIHAVSLLSAAKG